MIYPLDITDYLTFKQLGSFYSRVHFIEEENAQIILGQKNLEFFLIMSEKREVQKKKYHPFRYLEITCAIYISMHAPRSEKKDVH